MIKITDSMIMQINNDPEKYANSIYVTKLVDILKALSDAYYNKLSLVNDDIYDELKDNLEERNPNNKFLKEIGSSIKIDIDKIILPYPMGSLTKVKPEKDNLDIWIKKYSGPYVLSDKEDGISAQFYKKSDNEYKLFTRGNGIIGQDISNLINYIIPTSVKVTNIPIGMSIRGEIIMSKSNFDTIKHEMKNARNTVAGIVNSKTIDNTFKKIANLCDFVTYEIMFPRYKQQDQIKLLKEFGFKIVEYKIVKELNYNMLSEYLKQRRISSDYEVDGIVVMDDNIIHDLASPQSNPEYAFAYKTVLDDQVALANVVKVDWQPSKDGYLKPTIVIEPINLVGVTITNATAFNADFVEKNKLGAGAQVKIVRSGDVIPHIMEVTKPAKSGKAQMPDVPYKWTSTHVDIIMEDIYSAQNNMGNLVIAKQLDYFFEKIGASFIGEGILIKLVSAGYKSVHDILNANKKQLAQIDGIGDKLVNKIFESITTALTKVKLNTLMGASHVFGRGLGERKLKEVLLMYPDILNDKSNKKDLMIKIMAVDGFSTITATKFCDNLEEFKQFLKKLKTIDYVKVALTHLDNNDSEKLNKLDNINEENKQDLTGKVFVFTGFRDKDLEEKINELNGKVSTSVSKKTSAVVKANNAESSSKLVDADKLGVPILTKEDFITEYNLQ